MSPDVVQLHWHLPSLEAGFFSRIPALPGVSSARQSHAVLLLSGLVSALVLVVEHEEF